jgi:hypothetical protein
MVHFPSGEMGAGDVPLLPLPIGCQDERTFLCADQYPNFAHGSFLFWLSIRFLVSGSAATNEKN